jgi:uncharacterized protein with PIN domain
MVVDTSVVIAILPEEVDGPSRIRALIEASGAVRSVAFYVEVRIVAGAPGDQGETEVDGTVVGCGSDVVLVTSAQAAARR